MIQFRRREILLIFVMLVVITAAVFGVGIYMGHEVAALKQEVRGDSQLELVMAEPLEAEPIKKEPEPVVPAPARPLTGYTIQVSLLDEFEKAEALRDKMKELGFPSVFLN